ncbi:MAG: 2-phosphosulfolactate phosphatase [Bacteroidota bacterium]
MQVELFFTPNQTDEMSLRGKTVIVIDVLRASTTIATALRSGVKEIIPVATVESAVKISGNLFGDVILLGGERNGKMIEGFNLGNSPLEYTEERVKGKSVIFSSTNGSQAIVKARYAREMFVCGFINISVVTEYLRAARRDVVVLCAGKNGMFSIEDAVCAGMVLQKLSESESTAVVLSDAALAALTLYKAFGKNILKMLKSSEHGRYLTEIGFAEDLVVCAGVDTIPILPQFIGSVIKMKKEVEKKEEPRVPVSS